MMGMPVKYHVHRIATQRLLQPTGAEIRVDLPRLSFHSCGDGRVVEQRNLTRRAQATERGFQLESLV